MVGELFLQLVNGDERVMIAVVVAKTRDEELMLDLITEVLALLHLLREGSLPGDMFFSIGVTFHLHDQLLDFGQVAVSIRSTC